jgi:Asp-tRNA(Asn)/Glu-tRNA(Gln) amidotransferase A subunit family amidase
LLPLAPSFDTVGWLTRDAATLSGVARVSLDPAAQSPVSRTFVVAPALTALATDEVRNAFGAALADLGLSDIPSIDVGDVDELFEAFRMTQATEAWASWGAWVGAHPGALGDDIAARFAFASTITEEQGLAAAAAFDSARGRLDALLGDRVLLLPSASSVAPSATADAEEVESTRAGTLRLTCVAGLTGRPGLSVPALWIERESSPIDVPVGLGLVGPRFGDLALIELGATLEDALRRA